MAKFSKDAICHILHLSLVRLRDRLRHLLHIIDLCLAFASLNSLAALLNLSLGVFLTLGNGFGFLRLVFGGLDRLYGLGL